MRRPTEPHPELSEPVPTEADHTSQTRFGPRPVPEGHQTAAAHKRRKTVSSRIPPSGRVSPDGRQVWPEPSLTTKIIVWGGVALGVAGVTAATSMLARKLVGDDNHASHRHDRHGSTSAPRFAGLDANEQEEIRRRVHAQAREDALHAAELRAKAKRTRRPRGNIAQDLTKTATELSEGLNGVAQSLGTAFNSFRGVA
ncbi:MAG: hypothetical protein FJX25_08645, partial [Alphaproteobacteria bacterium]|nr:hypothetical protein [Alphaproteobacteria bacterium]